MTDERTGPYRETESTNDVFVFFEPNGERAFEIIDCEDRDEARNIASSWAVENNATVVLEQWRMNVQRERIAVETIIGISEREAARA